MTERPVTPEGARYEWQKVTRYAITWAGWIGLLFALAQCGAQSGGNGPSIVIDEHRYGVCWPKDPRP
jgi:hypothetical protein